MMAAPASCRVATNRAPAPTSALVTWKLPLPTTPNTWSRPRPASSRPIASATRIPVAPFFERCGAPAAPGQTRARRAASSVAADELVGGGSLLDDPVLLEEAHLLVDGVLVELGLEDGQAHPTGDL